MFGFLLSSWRRLPEPTRKGMLRDSYRVNVAALSPDDLTAIQTALPPAAQRPFAELTEALRAAWS